MAKTDDNILRTEENGVEYFTVRASGKSGLSGSGISRSLGINRKILVYWLTKIEKSVASEKLPESLELLRGKALTLASGVKYKNARILSSDVWAAFTEYFALDASTPTKEARSVLRAISRIGAESYIQGKTGWLPNDYQSSKQARATLNRIMQNPRNYSPVCEKEMCIKIQKWYGFSSSKFYWWYCYSFFKNHEVIDLNKHNPVLEITSKSGKKRTARKNKIHQHLDEDTVTKLQDFNEYLWRLVEVCDSRTEFEKKWNNKYGQPCQLELFDLWDFA